MHALPNNNQATSPARCGVHESVRKRGINGTRLLPLKVHKESHLIRKPSSHGSSSSSNNNSLSSSSCSSHQSGNVSIVSLPDNEPYRKKEPVVIYTQSPKVIHARASDFMALVQKLTGYSRSSEEEIALMPQPDYVENVDQKPVAPLVQTNEDKRSNLDAKPSPKTICQVSSPSNSYLKDIPLYTPNSMDLLCSPLQRRYIWPTNGNSVSPSVLEFMKQLSEF